MPGPVSDSYDPEFGTGANCAEIVEAIDGVIDRLTKQLGEERLYILDVVRGPDNGPHKHGGELSERELRIIRFCLYRAKESI